ncbi:MAG: hypothetical protein ACRDUV_17805 [Pseudonocardiaceae bacterium]
MAASEGFDAGYRRRASGTHAALMGEGFPTAVQPFSFDSVRRSGAVRECDRGAAGVRRCSTWAAAKAGQGCGWRNTATLG